MRQGSTLIAKAFFSMKVPGARGKPALVSIGDRFTVTSPGYRNIDTVKIGRSRTARLNQGYLLTKEQVETLFEMEGI